MIKLLPVTTLAVLLMGCPYGAEVPLDGPSVKIDKNLLGEWESKSSQDYNFTVFKDNEYTYKILKVKVEGHGDAHDTSTYKAYLVDLNGTMFLSLWDASASKKTYLFYKYEMAPSGAKATLTPVTDNIDEKFETSKELKAFFLKYMSLSFFYDKDPDVYLKKE